MNSHFFKLPTRPQIYIGRQDFVIHYATHKRVLHLGCADQGLSQAKLERGEFLHERLNAVCTSLWGIDIDDEGINWMRSHGWQNIFTSDLEDLSAVHPFLTEPFDLILLTEVIEHLDSPGKFLTSIRPFFQSHTELLITTPNATSLSNLLQVFGGQEQVHPDHNYWFSLATLQNLLQKFDFQITHCALYSQYDFTRPLVGKYLPQPAKIVLAQPEANAQLTPKNSPRQPHKHNPLGWIKANMRALLYGLLLHKAPFFADGLIVIAKPSLERN